MPFWCTVYPLCGLIKYLGLYAISFEVSSHRRKSVLSIWCERWTLVASMRLASKSHSCKMQILADEPPLQINLWLVTL